MPSGPTCDDSGWHCFHDVSGTMRSHEDGHSKRPLHPPAAGASFVRWAPSYDPYPLPTRLDLKRLSGKPHTIGLSAACSSESGGPPFGAVHGLVGGLQESSWDRIG
jgi:hypothetical protein